MNYLYQSFLCDAFHGDYDTANYHHFLEHTLVSFYIVICCITMSMVHKPNRLCTRHFYGLDNKITPYLLWARHTRSSHRHQEYSGSVVPTSTIDHWDFAGIESTVSSLTIIFLHPILTLHHPINILFITLYKLCIKIVPKEYKIKTTSNYETMLFAKISSKLLHNSPIRSCTSKPWSQICLTELCISKDIQAVWKVNIRLMLQFRGKVNWQSFVQI